MFAPVGPFIAEAIKLTAAQKALLTAVLLLGDCFFRILLGLMTEHLGARKTGLIGLGATLIPLIAWQFAQEFHGISRCGFAPRNRAGRVVRQDYRQYPDRDYRD